MDEQEKELFLIEERSREGGDSKNITNLESFHIKLTHTLTYKNQ